MNKTTTLHIDDYPELLTVTEVARILRVSALTIKRWGKVGKFPFFRINTRGDRRYRKFDIKNYLERLSEHG